MQSYLFKDFTEKLKNLDKDQLNVVLSALNKMGNNFEIVPNEISSRISKEFLNQTLTLNVVLFKIIP